MFSILPCKDKDRLKDYPEGTTLLIYTEDNKERGHIAYRLNMSAYEILSIDIGEVVDPIYPITKDMLLRADALIRAVGSIALSNGLLTLCSKLTDFDPVFTDFGFFKKGEYYTLYLNKLFAKGCSGCSGCK